MANIVDRHVVVLAPEERRLLVALARAKHVHRRNLALPLGDDPVLDAHSAPTRERVGEPGNVACGEDARSAGFQERVDHDAAVNAQARLLREVRSRTHTNAHHHEVRIEPRAIIQDDLPVLDGRRLSPEVEGDPVQLVFGPDEVPEFGTEHLFERSRVGRDDLDAQSALDQGSRDLKADEARPNHHRDLASLGMLDDRAAVVERPEREDMRLVGARDRQADRLGAGGQQQLVEVEAAPVSQPNASLARIQGGDRRVEFQADAPPFIEARGFEEDPRLRSLAGEEILGEVRSVDGRLGIGRKDRHLAAEPLAAQPLCGREAGSTTSDDDEASAVRLLARRRALLPSPSAASRGR